MPKPTQTRANISGKARSLANLTTHRTVRRSKDEMDRIVRQYNFLVNGGMPRTKAAKAAGIPKSTIKRWFRNEKNYISTKTFYTPHYTSLSDSISILTNSLPADRDILIDSTFSFALWLRWPAGQERIDLALAACALAYVIKDPGKPYLADLGPEALRFLSTRIRFDALISLFSIYTSDPPWFDYSLRELPLDFDVTDKHIRNDQDLCADVIWLWLNAPSELRGRQSLKQTHLKLQKLYENYESISYAELRKIWSRLSTAAVFYYVGKHGASIDFDISPCSVGFPVDVDTIVRSTEQRVIYFGRCKWVFEELKRCLHHQTYKSLKAPRFPNRLRAEHFRQLSRKL